MRSGKNQAPGEDGGVDGERQRDDLGDQGEAPM